MATYEELKKKREAAEKARDKAYAALSDTHEEWAQVLIERNAALPDGFYAEPDIAPLGGDFPVYLKVQGTWFWHNGTAFEEPEWIDEDGFDIDVIPLSEVRL
jgi:hypothetical protein